MVKVLLISTTRRIQATYTTQPTIINYQSIHPQPVIYQTTKISKPAVTTRDVPLRLQNVGDLTLRSITQSSTGGEHEDIDRKASSRFGINNSVPTVPPLLGPLVYPLFPIVD